MKSVDRRSGYYDREKETMAPAARRRYQETWLRALVALAWERAPGVRRRMEVARLGPKDLGSLASLSRLPVIKKGAMPDLQKSDPPFGGFCTVPMKQIRRIFVSPGPIYEPLGPEVGGWHFDARLSPPPSGGFCPAPMKQLRRIFVSPGPIYEPLGPEVGGWHFEAGLYAGGFRPGDVVLNTFAYHLTPAAHMVDEALNLIGCTAIPTGVGNTDTQVGIAKAVGATGFVGTPSFLMTVLKRAEGVGAGRLPFQVAQVGAEALPESLRRTFEDQYGIMTRQGFGTADLGLVAYECVEKSGMHLVEEAIVHVCDPHSGEQLPNGQIGELVATVNHQTYPMIRFGTGDLTVIDDARCPCGRTSARMLGWRGRADEGTKVRRMFIPPRPADEVAAKVTGVARCQVVVTLKDHQHVITFCVELAEA